MNIFQRLHGVVLNSPLMMVTELAEFGSLLDCLRKQCGHTSVLGIIQILCTFAMQSI